MSFFQGLLVGLLVLEVIGYVGMIGKPRQSVSPEMAVCQILMNAFLIWGIVAKW